MLKYADILALRGGERVLCAWVLSPCSPAPGLGFLRSKVGTCFPSRQCVALLAAVGRIVFLQRRPLSSPRAA